MNHASDIGAIEQRLPGPYPPLNGIIYSATLESTVKTREEAITMLFTNTR